MSRDLQDCAMHICFRMHGSDRVIIMASLHSGSRCDSHVLRRRMPWACSAPVFAINSAFAIMIAVLSSRIDDVQPARTCPPHTRAT